MLAFYQVICVKSFIHPFIPLCSDVKSRAESLAWHLRLSCQIKCRMPRSLWISNKQRVHFYSKYAVYLDGNIIHGLSEIHIQRHILVFYLQIRKRATDPTPPQLIFPRWRTNPLLLPKQVSTFPTCLHIPDGTGLFMAASVQLACLSPLSTHLEGSVQTTSFP